MIEKIEKNIDFPLEVEGKSKIGDNYDNYAIVESLGFKMLDPKYNDVKLLQWESSNNLRGNNVFAYDKIAKTLIGKGSIENGIINISIIQKGIKRIIKNEMDIILFIKEN